MCPDFSLKYIERASTTKKYEGARTKHFFATPKESEVNLRIVSSLHFSQSPILQFAHAVCEGASLWRKRTAAEERRADCDW